MNAPLIDFVDGTRPRASRPAIVLLAAGIAVILAGTVLTGRSWQAREAAVAESNRVAGERAPTPVRESAPLDPRVLGAARTLAGRLATPWSELLALLEANPVKDLTLSGFEPNSERNEMRITGQARSLERVVDYLRFLQKQPRVVRAVLVSHQVQADEPGTPVRFQVQVIWRAQ
jgi:hypothetical protein